MHIIFQNITPTKTELLSLQLPPIYVQSDTHQPQTQHIAAPRSNDSEDDFQDPPIQK